MSVLPSRLWLEGKLGMFRWAPVNPSFVSGFLLELEQCAVTQQDGGEGWRVSNEGLVPCLT